MKRILLILVVLAALLVACQAQPAEVIPEPEYTYPAEELEPEPAESETEQILSADSAEDNRPLWAYGRTILWDFAESDDPLELAIYNTVIPYIWVKQWRNLDYPDFDHQSQFGLLHYVVFGIVRGFFDSPFTVEEHDVEVFGRYVTLPLIIEFWDDQEQTHILPRDIFDGIIARHLYNPAFDYDLLIEQGLMLPDGSAYTITSPFMSGEGMLFVGDLSTRDDGMVAFRLDAEFSLTLPDDRALSVFFTLAPTNYNFFANCGGAHRTSMIDSYRAVKHSIKRFILLDMGAAI